MSLIYALQYALLRVPWEYVPDLCLLRAWSPATYPPLQASSSEHRRQNTLLLISAGIAKKREMYPQVKRCRVRINNFSYVGDRPFRERMTVIHEVVIIPTTGRIIKIELIKEIKEINEHNNNDFKNKTKLKKRKIRKKK